MSKRVTNNSTSAGREGVGIRLERVSYAYDREETKKGRGGFVLRDLSLEVPAGAVTALLGPNGSGKTTLIHLMLGLFTPTHGKVLLADRLHGSYTRRELSQQIGIVPQDEGLVFELPVLEYALLGRAPYLGLLETPGEADREVARRAIREAGLEAFGERPVPTLSGGERQLATIARALAQESKVLLLDEPTSHLDLANSRRVLVLLRQLREAGTTIVFTTHDPNAAIAVADWTILLRGGQALAVGPTSEVLTSASLSATYGVAVEVVQMDGHPVVLAPYLI